LTPSQSGREELFEKGRLNGGGCPSIMHPLAAVLAQMAGDGQVVPDSGHASAMRLCAHKSDT